MSFAFLSGFSSVSPTGNPAFSIARPSAAVSRPAFSTSASPSGLSAQSRTRKQDHPPRQAFAGAVSESDYDDSDPVDSHSDSQSDSESSEGPASADSDDSGRDYSEEAPEARAFADEDLKTQEFIDAVKSLTLEEPLSEPMVTISDDDPEEIVRRRQVDALLDNSRPLLVHWDSIPATDATAIPEHWRQPPTVTWAGKPLKTPDLSMGTSVNDKFAKLSEALYMAEQKAREEIRARAAERQAAAEAARATRQDGEQKGKL